jgi:hypothetical protein
LIVSNLSKRQIYFLEIKSKREEVKLRTQIKRTVTYFLKLTSKTA